MKKIFLFIFLIIFLSGCGLQHRPDHFSTTPLAKNNYGKLLTNKTNNNHDFFW
ncbi:lipoprotein [Francisella sp. SYW-9]|uniref:lipoprotein n=1 Tax=Francisella sp. SYW-9 TaxID=2610888 RepID=UPI00168D33B8|nr:lipoprotein [Francisella sp. SYW-9]